MSRGAMERRRHRERRHDQNFTRSRTQAGCGLVVGIPLGWIIWTRVASSHPDLRHNLTVGIICIACVAFFAAVCAYMYGDRFWRGIGRWWPW